MWQSKNTTGAIDIDNAKAGDFYVAVYADTEKNNKNSHQTHYFSILATTSRMVLSGNTGFEVTEMYGVWKTEGMFFVFDVASSDDFAENNGRTLEIYVEGETDRKDTFNVAITNSDLYADCGDKTQCPDYTTCIDDKNETSTALYHFQIFENRKAGTPVIIASSDEVFCSVDGTDCSYYISVWFDESVETHKDENDWNTVKITITSTNIKNWKTIRSLC